VLKRQPELYENNAWKTNIHLAQALANCEKPETGVLLLGLASSRFFSYQRGVFGIKELLLQEHR